MEISIFVLGFVLLVLTVFGISSVFLYGSIFESSRIWIRNKVPFLAGWTICQLCISFWLGLALGPIFIEEASLMFYILFAFAVAGISWLLGAFTQAALYIKAKFEKDLVNKK